MTRGASQKTCLCYSLSLRLRSLPPAMRQGHCRTPHGRSRAAPLSLSPSLRGSGRFTVATRRGSATPHAGAAALRPYHYPLHCGAVVASRWRRGAAAPRPTRAQPRCAPIIIPFIAGQWSLPPRRTAGAGKGGKVSIPFIAGQWSLRIGPERSCSGELESQSPSLRGSGRFSMRAGMRWRCWRSLNPLHCLPGVVSIPFIAGQWSLLASSGVLQVRLPVSIPFIAGQWSLLGVYALVGVTSVLFQSPSLRGSGRFKGGSMDDDAIFIMSQSPSLRGSGRFEAAARRDAERRAGLNPLHCGAVVASPCRCCRRI